MFCVTFSVQLYTMPDYLGDDQRKTKEEDKDDSPIRGKTAYNVQN